VKSSVPLALVCAALVAACQASNDEPASSSAADGPSTMKLTSTAFANGETIPAEFTCDHGGTSPPLQWSEPPAGTQGFALVVEDPDAPSGVFRHWGVYDIPMSTRQIDTGAGEAGRHALQQVPNDFGETGYGAPCPPHGDKPHRYRFRLLALDLEQFPDEPKDAGDILAKSDRHVLGSAELVGRYGRD
jgi:Raf kinase inhibitor-like YbhB/YbcL family protein